MAKIVKRIWTSRGPTGKRAKHVAYGFTLMANGKRERRVSSEWLTEAEALNGLAQRQKELAAGVVGRPADRTLGELAEDTSGTRLRPSHRSGPWRTTSGSWRAGSCRPSAPPSSSGN